jgi:hypothetical protein
LQSSVVFFPRDDVVPGGDPVAELDVVAEDTGVDDVAVDTGSGGGV